MSNQSPAEKAQKSVLVRLTLGFLLLSLVFGALTIIIAALLAPALVAGLASVTFAVLSLREL